MKLNEYPSLIENAVKALSEADRELGSIKQAIADAEAMAELKVVFDAALKNDAQRKARKSEVLLRDKDYRKLLDIQDDAVQQKTDRLARLEYLRNAFSVARLEMQMRIAERTVGTDLGF